MKRKLTKTDIQNFAELTEDFHPLHTSRSYATEHGFKDIMAHGLLISSFSSALIGMKLPGENTIIMSQSFKYRKPAFPGDLLTIIGEITSVDARFSMSEVKIKIRNQDEILVSSGLYKIKIRS